jgi:branched-chain amino acid transport system permease protein
VFRLAIIAGGLAVAAGLYLVVNHTRVGMLLRAGASNAPMVSAFGIDIGRLFMIVFGFGAMLAGFAGAMVAPILSVEPGMGDSILILTFVVIVIGGIGSIRGAFIAALLVGCVDTLGRTFGPILLRMALDPSAASQTGRTLAPMLIYILMAAVLFFRPSGLFPAKGRPAWRSKRIRNEAHRSKRRLSAGDWQNRCANERTASIQAEAFRRRLTKSTRRNEQSQ